ncbi:hypothetical protein ACL02O_23005 [Micromonospora sp. MS34]|uniref:hypothetical protein n=1 Tax=Micromonospora sp. MS34 TaxID=3385971 RepID=UPI00399FDA7A
MRVITVIAGLTAFLLGPAALDVAVSPAVGTASATTVAGGFEWATPGADSTEPTGTTVNGGFEWA